MADNTLRKYQAARALDKVRLLSAFAIPEASRRKLNGTTTLYTFPDGSYLKIYAHSSRADCWHPAWKGTADDIHLGPMKGVPLRINAQGI